MTHRVLVTGSAGRLGQAAVTALAKAGHHVVGFDLNPTPGLPPERSFVGTLADVELLKQAAAGVDRIIHLAATPDDARFPRGNPPDDGDNFVSDLVPNNVVGLYHLLEVARTLKVPRVLLASSGQVVDRHIFAGRVPVDAATPFAPRYLYACTKVFLETMGQVYAREHGLTVLAVRFGWCPRPGQEAEFARSPVGPDVYLSPGDAGRFFVRAVEAEVEGFHVLYATSRPATQTLHDLTETTRLIGYEPQDMWAKER